MTPETERALRAATLDLVAAQRAREEAVTAAHTAGASIGEMATFLRV